MVSSDAIANTRVLMFSFQVVSVAVLLGVSIYPDEWGALTKFDDTQVAALGINDAKAVGFNERFNIEFKAPESDAHTDGDNMADWKITIKCSKYTHQQNKFTDRCTEIKVERPIYGALIIIITVLGLVQFTGASVTVCKIKFTNTAIRILATLASLIILAFSTRMLHIFLREEENIGKLSSHGKTYFGLTVTFSVLLFIGRIGALIADHMSADDDSAPGPARVVQEHGKEYQNPIFDLSAALL